PSLTAVQPSTIGGTGTIPTTAAHEYSTDGAAWTSCTGETSNLAAGGYLVRVKASGNALASDAQTITITAYDPSAEPTPAAVFTATGADAGTLTNVAAGMTYSIDGGAAATITGTSVELTGLVPCTITVINPGNGTTTTDSAPQTITVTKADTPALTAAQPTTIGGTGTIPTTAAHEYSTDGTTWTSCTGETANLAAGGYLVRVKASGNSLASDAQTITITEYTIPSSSGGGGGSGATLSTKQKSIAHITETDLSRLIRENRTFTVEADNGATVVFDTEALKGIADLIKGSADIEFTNKDADGAPSNSTAYELNVTSGGKTINGFGGTMTLTIPFSPDENTDPNRITVLKNGEEANKDKTAVSFGQKTGTLTLSTSGDSSRFVVGHEAFPYADVPEDSYCFDAVDWADANGITEGTAAAAFSPELTCTRAQMVTFIWRAFGRPEPLTNDKPFSDLDEGAYYYKAVLWAYENGIAKGIGGGLFDPDGTVTRAQCITFLYRALGETAEGGNTFTDVSADAYYYDAVIWAVEKGIAFGTGDGRFSPDAPCMRAHIVTFLYRAYGER
ncbi:MAG: S-layer homology domain-containing protein, partial [Clostridia bacterium]|nr:S-layer homology domain-containing protein [Clostridia bacterium]